MVQALAELAFVEGTIGVFEASLAVQAAIQQLAVVAAAIGQQGIGGRRRGAGVTGSQQQDKQQGQGQAHVDSTLPSFMGKRGVCRIRGGHAYNARSR
ncbi:hypothetical protein D3C77_662510 [compost metagenome]